jgi:hypothetical protein
MSDDLTGQLRLSLASAFERESHFTLVCAAFEEWSDDGNMRHFLGTKGKEELKKAVNESSLDSIIQRSATSAAQQFVAAYNKLPAVVMTWYIYGQFKVAALTQIILDEVERVLPGYNNEPADGDEIEIVRRRLDKTTVPREAWLEEK